jgi:hypothetical protein
MTNPTTLIGLAERCEQAAWPDRELDAEIARALDWKPLYRDDYSKWWPPAAVEDSRAKKRSILHHPTQPLPAFTDSLDAAVTLYPARPEVIPSCPRKASAAALRARAAMAEPSSDT